MPPKSKGKGKNAAAKTKAHTLIDGLTKDELSKEQLEEYIVRLREELDREREERNYFQLERDKIQTFWDVTARQLRNAKAERINLDKNIEDNEGHHQVEMKVYRQKMKHLLCEHQNTISELEADGLVSSEEVQQEQRQLESKLHNEMRSIMVDIQELDNESLVMELELKHEEGMTETRKRWEKKLIDIEADYEQKMKLLLQDLDNMRKNETSEREEKCKTHISALIENHKNVFLGAHAMVQDMREDMDTNSLMTREIEKLKAEKAAKEKNLIPVLQDNKSLTDLIADLQEEISDIEKKMKYNIFKKDITEVKEKQLSDLKCDYEVLKMKFSQLQLERDELYKSHTESIEWVQHKADVKSMQLERKLQALTDSVEKTQAQLNAVLSAPHVDQTALRGITDKIEEKLHSSNFVIKNLQYKKAQISKARKDLLLTYEAKQRALGIPVEELSAKPFESSLAGKSLEQGSDLSFTPKQQK